MSCAADVIQRHVERWFGSEWGKRPVVVAIHGPQGSGKSTAAAALAARFNAKGIRTAAIGLDDFYLAFEKQQHVAQCHAGNRLLQLRGNAGTHNLDLLEKTLLQLTGRVSRTVALPKYDKAAHGGCGDTAPESTWAAVAAPVDLLIVEGWLLGYDGSLRDGAPAIDDDFRPVLDNIVEYARRLHPLFDALVELAVPNGDYGVVYDWRWQQEEALRVALDDPTAGMDLARVRDFCDRFMPAYHFLRVSSQWDAVGRHALLQLTPSRSVQITL